MGDLGLPPSLLITLQDLQRQWVTETVETAVNRLLEYRIVGVCSRKQRHT